MSQTSELRLSDYQHVMWDWNGTLLDDAWLCVEMMNEVLSKRGLPPLTVERYREEFRFPVIDYYRRLGFDFEEESFEILGTEFIVGYEKRRLECQLQPHAREVLSAIRDRGISQSVLSAYKQHSLQEFIRHFGLDEFFINLVGLDNHYANGKIDNARQWIAELEYGPSDVVLIGDTVHDYEVAQSIGAHCILVESGHASRRNLEACEAPLLSGLQELLNTLF